MKSFNIAGCLLVAAVLSGCASPSVTGPQGPRIVSSGRATQDGQYGEIGLQFSTAGDFVAFFSPSRWPSPVDTGGPLSWINPLAWQEDAGRTSRILFGQVALVGGVVAAASADVGGSGSSGSSGTTSVDPDIPNSQEKPVLPGGQGGPGGVVGPVGPGG